VRYTQQPLTPSMHARVLGGRFEIIALAVRAVAEAQLALKAAIDQGVRFINQRTVQNVAGAWSTPSTSTTNAIPPRSS